MADVVPLSQAAAPSIARWQLALLMFVTAPLSWLLMTIFHESGHVLAAWLTGGNVERMVLDPLAGARTDVHPNPHPLIVAWAGAVFGAMAPVAVWLFAIRHRWRAKFLLQFFAGFCLLANGTYLAFGTLLRFGDAGDLVRHGAAAWQLWLFGAVTSVAGLTLWHFLGRRMGFRTDNTALRGIDAYLCCALFVVLLAAELGLKWAVYDR